MNRRLLYPVFFLTLITCSAPRSGLQNIGTHSLYYEVFGSGQPVVVIDVGAGETYQGWKPIIDSVSAQCKVIVYDRAGYGRSDAGPEPRDARTEAGELHVLLSKIGVKPPYLLAGHSLGAINLQVFADLFPTDVCGMVLLDPSPKAWIAGEGFPELRSMLGEATAALLDQATQADQTGDLEAKRQAGFLRALASEHLELFNLTGRQILSIQSFGKTPLTVIGSEIPNPRFGNSAEAFQAFWISQNKALAGLSSRGTFILAKNTTHQIPQEAPGLVIRAILDLAGVYRLELSTLSKKDVNLKNYPVLI